MKLKSKKHRRRGSEHQKERQMERLEWEGNRVHRCDNPNKVNPWGMRPKDNFFSPDPVMLGDLKKFKKQVKIIIPPKRTPKRS